MAVRLYRKGHFVVTTATSYSSVQEDAVARDERVSMGSVIGLEEALSNINSKLNLYNIENMINEKVESILTSRGIY